MLRILTIMTKNKENESMKFLIAFTPLENAPRLATRLFHILRTRGLMPSVRFLTGFTIFIIFTVGFGKIAFADQVILKDGTIYDGTIAGANHDSLRLKVDSKIKEVPCSQILVLVFASGDILYLKNGENLICKVVEKSKDTVVVVVPEGVKRMSNIEVIKVGYCFGPELKVSALPWTGEAFVNKPNKAIWAGEFKENIYLSSSMSVHIASLQDWRKQFPGISETALSTLGFNNGLELGDVLSRMVRISVMYESFKFRKVNIAYPESFKDQVLATFLSGGIKIGFSPRTLPALYIYGGGDLGSLKGTEKIEDYEGYDYECSGSTLGFRLKIGADYFISDNYSISVEIGSLSAKVTNLKLLGQTIPNYTLDFSGFSILVGTTVHFPVLK